MDCSRYNRVEFAAVGRLYGKRFNFADAINGGGLADYSDTKERKEMPQGRMVSFYLRFGHSYVTDNSYSWDTYFFPPYLPGRVSIKGSVLLG